MVACIVELPLFAVGGDFTASTPSKVVWFCPIQPGLPVVQA